MTESQETFVPPFRIAFIIDGVVQDVVNTDARLAAIFLSQPTIVDVTDQPNTNVITVGSVFNSELNTFSESEIISEEKVLVEGENSPTVDDSGETLSSSL